MAKQSFTTGQILTAAQMTTLQANDYNQTVSAKVASYTLVATDAGTRITMSNASPTTITVNTALFTAGDTLTITNIGAGVCTITAGTATVSTGGSLALAQYDSGTLYFSSTSAAIWNGANPGDITGVTAGTGISGGGTSGTVTVSIDTSVTVDKTTAQTLTNKTLTSPALTTPTISTLTTNGDLLYGTGSGALSRLGIGSTSQVLTVTGGVPVWATASGSSGPAFRATPGITIQTGVTAGVFTKVTLGTETFDTDSNFASSRFTPTKAGYYQFNMTADMISTTLANQYMARLYINGAAVNIFACYEGATTSADGQWIGSGSEVYYMNGTTDYAELYAYVGGGTVSFGVQSRFSGVWIRS